MVYQGTIRSRETIFSADSIDSSISFPVKEYDFKSAFSSGAFANRRSANQHLLDILNAEVHEISQKYLYGIAGVWGYTESRSGAAFDRVPVRAVDLFLYSHESNWDANPEVSARLYIEGKRVTDSPVTTCESMTVILGEEGKLRRRSPNLETFIVDWPDISPLGPTE
jgi:hypothetical protein